jgi:hypothetical protein
MMQPSGRRISRGQSMELLSSGEAQHMERQKFMNDRRELQVGETPNFYFHHRVFKDRR